MQSCPPCHIFLHHHHHLLQFPPLHHDLILCINRIDRPSRPPKNFKSRNTFPCIPWRKINTLVHAFHPRLTHPSNTTQHAGSQILSHHISFLISLPHTPIHQIDFLYCLLSPKLFLSTTHPSFLLSQISPYLPPKPHTTHTLQKCKLPKPQAQAL